MSYMGADTSALVDKRMWTGIATDITQSGSRTLQSYPDASDASILKFCIPPA